METEQVAAPVANFDDVIAQSAETIAAQEQVTPQPSRRGRPAGIYGKYNTKKKPMRATPTGENISSEVSESELVPMPPLSKFLAPQLKLVSKIPAKRLDVEQLALDDEEAKTISDALDEVLKLAFPDLGKLTPMQIALFNLGMVSCTVFSTKFNIYLLESAERRKIKATVNKTEVTELNLNTNLTSAPVQQSEKEYFGT